VNVIPAISFLLCGCAERGFGASPKALPIRPFALPYYKQGPYLATWCRKGAPHAPICDTGAAVPGEAPSTRVKKVGLLNRFRRCSFLCFISACGDLSNRLKKTSVLIFIRQCFEKIIDSSFKIRNLAKTLFRQFGESADY
jgi:hypothetical protein